MKAREYPSALPPKVVKSLYSRIRQTADGCWEWTGATIRGGYGRAIITNDACKRENRAVHRLMHSLANGGVPADLPLDHLCRNRLCAAPAHLEPVTTRTNTMRGIGPSAENHKKAVCHKGHPLTGENLYEWNGHRNCRICKAASDAAYRERNADTLRKRALARYRRLRDTAVTS